MAPSDPVAEYLPAAHATARRWAARHGRGLLDEAMSAAGAAVAKAAEVYDPTRSSWESFAAGFVRKALRWLRLNGMRANGRRPRVGHLAEDPADAGEPVAWPADLVAKLRDGQRRVIELRYLERCSFAEIGREMGKTKQAAHRQHGRAIGRLKLLAGGMR